MCLGQRTINGSRVPASNLLYFSTAKRAGRLMVAQLFARLVFVTVIQHRAVVTGQDDQRVIRQTQFIQFVENRPRPENRTERSRHREAPCSSCRQIADWERAAREYHGLNSIKRTARPCFAR